MSPKRPVRAVAGDVCVWVGVCGGGNGEGANPYQVGNVAQNYYNNTTTLSQFQALGGVTQVNDVISDWSQSMGVSSTRFGDGTQQMTWFFIVYPSGNVAYRIAIWYYTSNNDTDARNGAGRTDTFTNMNEIDL